ncbi:hypothetical protein ABKN59_007331 [Abortiporus biennis]
MAVGLKERIICETCASSCNISMYVTDGKACSHFTQLVQDSIQQYSHAECKVTDAIVSAIKCALGNAIGLWDEESKSTLFSTVAELDHAQYALNLLSFILRNWDEKIIPLAGSEDNEITTTLRLRMRRVFSKIALLHNKFEVLPKEFFRSDAKLIPGLEAPQPISTGANLWHATLGKSYVVLKQPRNGGIPEKYYSFTEAFLSEFLIWWNLRHENIVELIGITDLEQKCFWGKPCLIIPEMLYADSHFYMKCLSHKEPEDLVQLKAHKWMRQAASGLEYLHGEGIAHGDLRGVNVLIDEKFDAHLSDFGMSVYSLGTDGGYASSRGGNCRRMQGTCFLSPTFASSYIPENLPSMVMMK